MRLPGRSHGSRDGLRATGQPVRTTGCGGLTLWDEREITLRSDPLDVRNP
jgi:hypothetical protein